MRGALALVWLVGLALFAAAVTLTWSRHPYWMDASEYCDTLGKGRWAVHPPGYILFVALGRLLYACGFAEPYLPLQLLTLVLTLGGMLALYRLLREVAGRLQCSLLVATFALSWVPLLINHTGTSAASDFCTAPLLLWAAVRLTARPSPSAAGMLALAMVLCGGFRLTTLVMMAPLLLAVVWANRRNPYVWGACALAGLVTVLLQLLTIRVWGGWDIYSFMVHKLNFNNGFHSVLRSGLTRLALLNAGRSLLWFGLATLGLWFALLSLRSPRPWDSKQRLLLTYGILATAGPVAVCTLYLCEHPGYCAPALAGFYLCVGVAWERAEGRLSFAKWPVLSIVASLLLYFSLHYYRAPATRGQAMANGLLLQFSADGAKHACYMSTSDWLRLADELRTQ